MLSLSRFRKQFIGLPLAILSVSAGCQRDSPSGLVSDELGIQREQDRPRASDAADPASQSDSDLLARAEDAIADNEHAAAIGPLRQLLIRSPQHAAGLFLLARIEAERGNLEEAIDLLASIPDDDPALGLAALGQRADYLSQLKRFEESISAWRRLLERGTRFDDMLRSRLADDLYASGMRWEAGWVLQELVDRGVAEEDHLRRLLNVTSWPKSRRELALGAPGKARGSASADRVGSHEPVVGSREQGDWDKAWEHFHERRFRDAKELLEKIVEQTPSTQSLVMLALAQSNLQLFDEARRTLAEAGSDAPRFPPYWTAVGDDWSQQGEDRRAVAAYARAVLADPTWEFAHERLVGALLKIGEVELARSVDERKFALAGPTEAFLAVGPTQPDDIPAGEALIGDLGRLGQMSQACVWLRHLAARHPGHVGDSETVKRRCETWKRLPEGQIAIRRLAGLDVSQYPDPAPTYLADAAKTRPPEMEGLTADEINRREAQPVLPDVAKELGLDIVYHNLPERKQRLLRLHEALGSGVAALDFDLDGWSDLYFGQASGDPPEIPGTRPNALVRRVGDRFQDVTELSGSDDRGYTTGVTSGDWNQDGWPDIVVGNLGKNSLFINQGDGTFVNVASVIGLTRDSFTSSLALADINADSLVDLVEIRYTDDPTIYDPLIVRPSGIAENYPGPNRFRSSLDSVWLSTPDGGTAELPLRTADSGQLSSAGVVETDATADFDVPRIGDDAYPGLGVVVTDLDHEPGLEIFVANDARPNQLWRFRSGPQGSLLTETAATAGLATSWQGKTTACMGVAMADFDRNGRPDLFVTNWINEWVNLYLQKSPGLFQDLAPKFSLDRWSDHHLGFGTQGVDYDNDGWVDVIVANGHIDDFSHIGLPQRMPTQLLKNRGDRFDQLELASTSGSYWEQPHIGRCVIKLDHNRDGRMDVVITDLMDPAALLENRTETANSFIQFQLVGTRCERSAIGARIEINSSTERQWSEVSAGDGYLGKNEAMIHFGLGQGPAQVDAIVHWPDGETTKHPNLAASKRYLLVQGEEAYPLH